MARKRKNGQGTVRLRKDGRWEGRHIVGYDENGKAKTKSVLAKTKAECLEKLKQLQDGCGPAEPFKVKPNMRFEDWIVYWYENHCQPTIRATTQKGYEEWIYVHAILALGQIPLNKLTQADCQKFLNEMKANGRKIHRDTKGPGMSERSVRSCYHVVRMSLERAIKDGLIKKNPILGCKLPPPGQKEMKVLSGEEIQRFLLQAKEEGMYELFLLELTTALIRLARAGDVELEAVFGPGFTGVMPISQFRSLDELEHWCVDRCLNLRELLGRQRSDSAWRTVERAKHYIGQHYADSELSVESVCTHLHLSPAYFSTLFKREEGMSFIAYVTNVRMERAAQLLLESDDKTYLIAEKTGYTDPNYFSYVFKRRFGISPSKYRAGGER